MDDPISPDAVQRRSDAVAAAHARPRLDGGRRSSPSGPWPSRRGSSTCRWSGTRSWPPRRIASRSRTIAAPAKRARDRRSQRARARLRAWTPTRSTRSPPRSPTPAPRPGALPRAGRLQRQGRARARRSAARAARRSPTCGGRRRPTRRVASPLSSSPASGFLKESRRFYPNRDLAAHLLGYVGIDNAGLAGIEAAYDSLIRGQQGKVLVQVDATKQAFLRVERPPTSGATLELTIDQYMQHVVERELRAGVEWANARRRVGDRDGPVARARCSRSRAIRPSTPTCIARRGETRRRNRAVQDLYEPGSTFKIITASAALEEQRRQADRSGGRERRHRSASGRAPSATITATACSRSSRWSRSRATSARSRSACALGAGALRRLRPQLRLRPAAVARLSAARTPASSGTGPR